MRAPFRAGSTCSPYVRSAPRGSAPDAFCRHTTVAPSSSISRTRVDVALRFFGDRLTKRADVGSVERGEGRVVGAGLGQRAVYRDDEGNLHALSARCTHLGCIVNWNSAERTWDCPCQARGSRREAR